MGSYRADVTVVMWHYIGIYTGEVRVVTWYYMGPYRRWVTVIIGITWVVTEDGLQ